MYNDTNISQDDNNLILSRIMDSRLYCIKFALHIEAVKLIPYFSMSNAQFKEFVR